MPSEHDTPGDPSAHGHRPTPEQIARMMESIRALEYFELTLHHPVLDEFRTVDMWSVDMVEALSSACADLERDGWHVTAIARDCHDCTVEDSDPTVDVSEDQERFDLMFDEIVRGENNQS
jgi:hypothetical protein